MVDSHCVSIIQKETSCVKNFWMKIGGHLVDRRFERREQPIRISAAGCETGRGETLCFSCSPNFTSFAGWRSKIVCESSGCWRLVSGLITAGPQPVDGDFLPDIQTELSYDMPHALERVLAGFVRAANSQGAWLAILRGDTLDISAQFNDPRSIGLSLSFDWNPFLRRINRTRAEMVVKKEQPEWNQIPRTPDLNPIQRYGAVCRWSWVSD